MYRKVMVPLDGSELAECVLPHVESLAKSGQAGSVILVRVAESFQSQSWGEATVWMSDEEKKEYDVTHRKAAASYLDDVAARLDVAGAGVEKVVLNGGVAWTLADYANKNNVDLVVIATHGRSGVSRWVMGSVAQRLLHSICAPVMVIRSPGCMPGA